MINSGPDVKEILGLLFVVVSTIALFISGRALARSKNLNPWLGSLAILNIFGLICIYLLALPKDIMTKAKYIGAFAVLFFAILGTILWLRMPDSMIKQTAQEAFQAEVDGNAEKMWTMSCPELQSNYLKDFGSKDAFIQKILTNSTIYANLRYWKVVDVDEFKGIYNEERATVIIETRYQNGDGEFIYLYLIKNDGEWKIHR